MLRASKSRLGRIADSKARVCLDQLPDAASRLLSPAVSSVPLPAASATAARASQFQRPLSSRASTPAASAQEAAAASWRAQAPAQASRALASGAAAPCEALDSTTSLLHTCGTAALFPSSPLPPLGPRATLTAAQSPRRAASSIPPGGKSLVLNFRGMSSSSSSSSSSVPVGGSPAGWGASWLSWYLGHLEASPVVTKSLTAGTIFVAADVTSQYLTYRLSASPAETLSEHSAAAGAASSVPEQPCRGGWHWDVQRTMRIGAAGLLLSGPTLHVWYGLMARWRPGRDLGSILQKIVAGTTLYGPVFNAVFFSANGALQGEGSKEIVGRLQRDMLPTFFNGLMYWPFCDLLTYRYVPVHLQGLRRDHSSRASTSSPRMPFLSPGLHGVQRSVSEQVQRPSGLPHPADTPTGLRKDHATGTVHLLQRACFSTSAVSPVRSASPLSGIPRGHSLFQGSAMAEHRLTQSEGVLGPAWACAGTPRAFVQLLTILDVADNSGAKKVQCIKVLKGAKPNAANIGDIIIASVKSADSQGRVKKGEVVRCVVVRSAVAKLRSDGSMVRFDRPAAVVITKTGEPIGTRVFGPVPHELRSKKLVKVLALAQHIA